jgi:hypothetical protein
VATITRSLSTTVARLESHSAESIATAERHFTEITRLSAVRQTLHAEAAKAAAVAKKISDLIAA